MATASEELAGQNLKTAIAWRVRAPRYWQPAATSPPRSQSATKPWRSRRQPT